MGIACQTGECLSSLSRSADKLLLRIPIALVGVSSLGTLAVLGSVARNHF